MLLLILASGVAWGGAEADTRLPSEPVNEPVELPVHFILNGEPKGEILVRMTTDGGYLITPRDLSASGAQVPQGRHLQIGAETYLELRSVPGATVEFDERMLQLAVTLPPSAFAATRLSLAPRSSTAAIQPQDSSAFLNYRLGYAAGTGSTPVLSLTTETGIRVGRFLLRNESAHTRESRRLSHLRFQTQLIHDDREQALRWVIGDNFASTGELGSTYNHAGFTLSKTYRLQPYFVTRPSATVAGAVTLPSEVNVYIGDNQVFRDQLPPGPYELSDFNYFGGQHDVRVVVRDAVGHEQVFSYPYYFTDRALARGLREYEYSVGVIRKNFGQASDEYGAVIASFSHRHGVTDALTLGVRGEGTAGRYNFGPTLVWRSDWLGDFSFGLSSSRDRNGSDLAYAFASEFQKGALNLRSGYAEAGRNYRTADPTLDRGLLRRRMFAGFGFGTPLLGNFNLQYSRLDTRVISARSDASLNYSRALFRRVLLFCTVRRQLAAGHATDLFAGLSYNPGDEYTLNASHTGTGGAQTDALQISNALGSAEGWGYRLTAEQARSTPVNATRLSPHLEYNGHHATLIVDGSAESSSGQYTGHAAAAVLGSFIAVGGELSASRKVEDSFALTRITPPLEGVRVYRNGQEIGRTGADGTLVVPSLGSFVDNEIRIEDRDLPIQYSLKSISQVVSPPLRSGSVIEFPVRKQRSLAGRLWLSQAGTEQPLEYRFVNFSALGTEAAFPTGADGEFYIENLVPGQYAGSVELEQGLCRFQLAVPDREEMMIELEEPVRCVPEP